MRAVNATFGETKVMMRPFLICISLGAIVAIHMPLTRLWNVEVTHMDMCMRRLHIHTFTAANSPPFVFVRTVHED